MTILSSDATGAPRLMRAIAPRAAALGMLPGEAARDHVAALAPLWVKHAPAMALSETGTQRLRNGSTVVRLAQQVDGVPLHQGELRVMMYANGSLAAVSGTLLPTLSSKLSFVSSPREALSRALDRLYGKARPQPQITETGERGGWMQLSVASDTQLRVTQARARRELGQVNGKLGAVWAVEVSGAAIPAPLTDPSITTFVAHRYLVTDGAGGIVSDTNLIHHDAYVYRVYAEPTGIRRPFDGALESFTPHPTGVPDGSAPGFAASNLVVVDSFNQNRDKWLPDDATTTAGNNAEAFSDIDGSGDFSEGDVRPNVTGGRILNFTYDPTLEALDSATQLKAGAVNSFFIVNWMHDWWYDSGFTEATGNAQLDNYGRGGVDGDRIIVHAQDGALAGSRDNAFMATPGDGLSPEMHMFLWTPGVDSAVVAPTGAIRSETFSAGPHTFDLTAQIVAGADAVDPTNDGCQPITTDLTGRIVLLTFSGTCGSLATVNNAKAAGAIGVVLADGALDDPRAFAGSAAANIPGLTIGKTSGEALAQAIAAGPVTITLHAAPNGVERDGDLDNAVVAHEWGHYLHQRLALCEAGQQCGGMSEGWGDFNALLMMLREGDNRSGAYADSSYAAADGTFDFGYFGLRRFPYSIDTTKNALRFRHIADENELPTTTPRGPGGAVANSEVHNQGEIWATMMWEVFNVLIDAHDVPIARRRMSDYIVAGLLLTPPEATFTEGRDAILAAASVLDSDDMLLMAAAFAGRGAGTCAVAPSNDVPDNAGLVESGTLAARLEISNAQVNDDGVSCDHDGYLDPGESGTIRVTVVNSGVLAGEEVSVTATSSSPGVRLGAPIKLGLVQPFTSVDLNVPVTLLASAPRNTNIALNLHIAGDGQCERNGVTVALRELTGVDEVANTAAVDHVETRQTPWTFTGGGAEALWSRETIDGSNHLWFGRNAGFPSDTQLVTPVLTASPTESFVFKFLHTFALEGSPGTLFDGGVIEASTDGGVTWTDVSALGVDPGYSGTLVADGANPLAGRPAYSGVADGFPTLTPVVLDFGTRFAGQSVRLRFRLGADLNTTFFGWLIDDIDVSGITNLPFTSLVAEPSTCTARATSLVETGVVATRVAPATSLREFDAAVCITNDSP